MRTGWGLGGEPGALFMWAPLDVRAPLLALRTPLCHHLGVTRERDDMRGASFALSDTSPGTACRWQLPGGAGLGLPCYLRRGSHLPRSSQLWSDNETGSLTCWKWWKRSSGRQVCLTAAGRGKKRQPSVLRTIRTLER